MERYEEKINLVAEMFMESFKNNNNKDFGKFIEACEYYEVNLIDVIKVMEGK